MKTTVKGIVDFFALNNETIEVDVFYDNGEAGFIGLVFDYMGERKVNEPALEKFADCKVLRTETMTDRDDGTITFDLIISRSDKNVK